MSLELPHQSSDPQDIFQPDACESAEEVQLPTDHIRRRLEDIMGDLPHIFFPIPCWEDGRQRCNRDGVIQDPRGEGKPSDQERGQLLLEQAGALLATLHERTDAGDTQQLEGALQAFQARFAAAQRISEYESLRIRWAYGSPYRKEV